MQRKKLSNSESFSFNNSLKLNIKKKKLFNKGKHLLTDKKGLSIHIKTSRNNDSNIEKKQKPLKSQRKLLSGYQYKNKSFIKFKRDFFEDSNKRKNKQTKFLENKPYSISKLHSNRKLNLSQLY